jgi:lipoyl(octanoyl) transferase
MNPCANRAVQEFDLGLTDYQAAWDYQTQLFEEALRIKKANRDLPEAQQHATPNYLIFCQHPHVFTLGKSGDAGHLLVSPDALPSIGASFYRINRGGDITYHGPGQLVVYPVLDLENFFTDIHRYMRLLEEAVIRTLAHYGIEAGRLPGLTGVWLGHENQARKICAMGVKTSRWVTLHGLALNVNTDLAYFDYIVPCGLAGRAVTSMQKELGRPLDLQQVQQQLRKHLIDLFAMQPQTAALATAPPAH